MDIEEETKSKIYNTLEEKDSALGRVRILTNIVEDIVNKENIEKEDIKETCLDFATYHVVGTGMGPLSSLEEVLDHLEDFAREYPDFSPPADKKLLEEISGSTGEFEHVVYYALQRLYGIKIYERYKENNPSQF